MDLETSKKLLKIFGIIILGILGILSGLLAFAGGGLIAAANQSDAATLGAGLAVVAGVILVISGIVSLLQGIFSVRAAKDTSKDNACMDICDNRYRNIGHQRYIQLGQWRKFDRRFYSRFGYKRAHLYCCQQYQEV